MLCPWKYRDIAGPYLKTTLQWNVIVAQSAISFNGSNLANINQPCVCKGLHERACTHTRTQISAYYIEAFQSHSNCASNNVAATILTSFRRLCDKHFTHARSNEFTRGCAGRQFRRAHARRPRWSTSARVQNHTRVCNCINMLCRTNREADANKIKFMFWDFRACIPKYASLDKQRAAK